MGRRAASGSAEPLCRLVRFEAADGVSLAGLLYEPRRATTRAIVWLHGTGGASIFDSKRTNLLGDLFTRSGFAFFPFNNRGAHLVRHLRTPDGSVAGGMAYERIRDCVPDIDGALRALRRRGYRDVTLAGHSTGANKIAVYDHHQPRNPVKRYILLAGGDDTGLVYQQLGPKRFAAALAKARAMVGAQRGDELVPKSVSPSFLSWSSFLDMADPDGDYNVFPFVEVLRGIRLSRRRPFRYVAAIRKPSLYLYGSDDEYCLGDVPACVAALATAVGRNAELDVIDGADHGFGGEEPALAARIVAWIDAHSRPKRP
jgi:pimeloyl-ACP methyl ester carboxylesterase